MDSLSSKMNLEKIEKIDLDKEYKLALKDQVFSDIVKKIKLPDSELKKYTSLIQECSDEYRNCLECKGLIDCKNRISGHVYFPNVKHGNIGFEYKSCRYYEKNKKNTQHLKNVKYFNMPSSLEDASISKIHKNDKNRFEAIMLVGEFLSGYNEYDDFKGLYLHGNFGCGKTYFIASLFNDLAKKGYQSSIVFWPEFLRQAFYDDFKDKYEYVKKVPLLLIDDIGAENLTAWNRDEILCPLLQYRMEEGLTTFFTSNLSLEDLEEHLASSKAGVDSIKASRIISRIKQLTTPIEMVSKNLRK
jgi:DNA replication protein